ncbi:HNH endonuclease [Geomonas oryzisoli]|uniref:HNH endonuclease n=1 Tax=Geomonas oryzisoli TaxID=2847992 RepID=A0ABX8JA64_9BACT|nr:HNH endonuclease [Geomonas oryzisoli]QWV94881.1 HNH endonuclease [Geomonas oryzisoli]
MELISDAAKEIPGFEGLYAVTRNGVVYSLPRRGVKKLKIMKHVKNMKADYIRVKLSCNGEDDLYYVHRLVAETYIPNPECKPMVNHIDGDKTNNRIENLEWVTRLENQIHAFETGLYPNCKIHPLKKNEVYDLVKSGMPIKDVAERYGMTPGGVRSLVRRYRPEEQRMAA